MIAATERLQFLRRQAVVDASGLPTSTLYNHISKGLWTRPVRLSTRCVGWPRHEVDRLLEARLRGASDDEVRSLVKRLEGMRGL